VLAVLHAAQSTPVTEQVRCPHPADRQRGALPNESQPKPMPCPFVCASSSLATLLCASQMASAVPRISARHLQRANYSITVSYIWRRPKPSADHMCGGQPLRFLMAVTTSEERT